MTVAKTLNKGGDPKEKASILAIAKSVGHAKKVIGKAATGIKQAKKPAPQSTVERDVQAAQLALETDRKVRKRDANDALKRLNSANHLLAKDLAKVSHLPDGKKKDQREQKLKSATESLITEAKEVQRELDSFKPAPVHKTSAPSKPVPKANKTPEQKTGSGAPD